MPKTILITGASSGLGRAILIAALSRGHRVAGTVRRAADQKRIEAEAPGRAMAPILDVTDTGAIAPVVATVERAFGPIDVLVNNAGYGLFGALEELSLDALRDQFAVNLFGAVAMIQAVLPGMRARRAGHILNMSSMGAQVTFPGLSAYHGSKFALQGMGDALEAELQPLGIRVTALQPGLFRSDWSGRSLRKPDETLPDYAAVTDRERMRDLRWGDPADLARVVLDTIERADPPSHLLIGPTAVDQVRARLLDLLDEVERNEPVSRSTGEG